MTSLRLNVDSTSAETGMVGLSELEAYGPPGQNVYPPVANAGAARTVLSLTQTQLDGRASSDPDGDALTYQWTQLSGPGVTLSDPTSATPTFVTPSGPTTLRFQLVVSDGTHQSQASTVDYTVLTPSGRNLGPGATATASTENTTTGQYARRAIDGVVSGFPASPTHEWATIGGGPGSWLQLTWPHPVTLHHLVLHDRPNLFDRSPPRRSRSATARRCL